MAKVKSKGTAIALGVANSEVAIAQVISIDLPEAESETFEADTLDNASAGIPYEPTGRTEGGSCSGEMFYGGANSVGAFTALLAAPASKHAAITFADNSTLDFDVAGVSLGGSVALKDGVKSKFSMKVSGVPTYA